MNGNATLVIVMSTAVVKAQRHSTTIASVRRPGETSAGSSTWW